ncbi:aminopeptidase N-like [Anticarsia gemmatalis]|uniref:aminopeptidase N-like n=1 Tax=Anticarsia gemmatalis TaxID=129554 RepID=UPI003F76C17A
MYLLPLLTLLGSVVCGPLSTDVKNVADTRPERYVLPTQTVPTFYDVSLFFDPGNTAFFTGRVSIRILPVATTNEIVLHAMEMTIAQNAINVFTDREPAVNLVQSFTLATDDTHFLRIRLNRELTVLQPATINIEYTGRYAANMFGVYVSTYESFGRQVSLVTSQLQPTFARRAFPCYDEPALKAIFRTTIYAPPAYPVVRSNMPLRTDLLKENVAGYNKFEFQDTLVMSTYLIAYLVSDLNFIENDVNPLWDVPFRVYSRPGTQNTAEFALDFGQRNLKALEEYIDFKYAFPKMDKAAVPDFAAGAMENWGLVIYREVALLVTEGVTTTATKQNVGRIICHENVHQWFGNEVGPQSWTYTWLNEGFANFFENFATDFVLPEWRMMDQFVIALQNVFQSDAVLSVNPMTHPVYTPSEILGTFNAVAYQKSGSVIRMMQHFLTPEVFRLGLIHYVKVMSRAAAVPTHLFVSLEAALANSSHSIPFPLTTIMDNWINRGGFPVLTVTRSAGTAESVVVTQERFLTDRTLQSSDRWHVPINWVLSSNPDFSDTKPLGWVPPAFPARSFDIPGLSQAQWYIFNKQQTGYYRVNYDVANWAALSKVLAENHQIIHLINRGQILDDAFNLARNGRLDYKYPFEISRYLVQEKDYVPWASVNPAFTYLDVVLSQSEVYNYFQRYILNLTEPIYQELGFNVITGEEHVAPYHRNIVLDLNCRHGNPNCISTAQALLEAFRNNPTQRLNPDLQTLVYCSGLRGGSVDNFNFLWDLYLSTSDSSEQSILLNSLGCTSNEELRTFYLNQVINDDGPVREQDRHTIIVSVINSSPDNMNAALDFVIQNFALIQPRVQGLTGTTNILNAFARRLTSQAHSAKVDQLYNTHQAIFTAGELASIAAIRENIAASIYWTNENAATVEAWLTENYGDKQEDDDSSATAVTSSLVVLISAFVAIFNY